MQVEIARALGAQMTRWAQQAAPLEVCGLVFGEPVAAGWRITGIEQARNVSDSPERRFEIDPAALLAAQRAMRSGGPTLLGYLHSHPSGVARPSACDAQRARDDGMLWLIIAGEDIGAFQAANGGALAGRFNPVRIVWMEVYRPMTIS